MAKKTVEAEIRVTGSKVAQKEIEAVGTAGDKSLGKLNKFGAESSRSIGSLVSSLATLAIRLGAIGAAGAAIAKVAMAGDAMTVQMNRLTAATGNVGVAQEVFEKLYQSSLKTGASLEDSVGAFTRFSIAAKDIGATNEQVVRLIQGIQGFGQLAGVSAGELGAATQQLGQALASGKLQGDELRSIMENLPQLAAALAQQLGMSVGQLREAGAEGRLTASTVFPALLRAAEQVQSKLANIPPTIGQGTQILLTSMDRFLAQMDAAIGLSRNLAAGLAAAGRGLDAARRGVLGAGSPAEQRQMNDERLRAIDAERKRLMEQGPSESLIGRETEDREKLFRIQQLNLEASRLIQQNYEYDNANRDRQDREEEGAAARAAATRRANAQAAYNELREKFDKEFKLRQEYNQRSQALIDARASGAIDDNQYLADSIRLKAQLDKELEDLNKPPGGGGGSHRATTGSLEASLNRIAESLGVIRLTTEELQSAQSIFENNQTAAERYNLALEHTVRLLKAGAITPETYNREVERLNKELEEADSSTKALDEAVDQFGFSFNSALEDAIINGRELSDVIQALTADIARMILRLTVTQPLAEGVSGLLKEVGGSIGKSFSNIFGGISLTAAPGKVSAPDLPKFAMGGVMTSRGPIPLRRYAGGGIANSPQLAMFGEGSGPEAYVPLPDGRRIPVSMSGSGLKIVNNTYVDAKGSTMSPAQWQAIARAEADRSSANMIERIKRDPQFAAMIRGR